MKADDGVFLSCLWVFKFIVFRIQRTPGLHVELRHFTFVKSDKGNFFSVRRPFEGLGHGKFFFVDPVCCSVDNPVCLSIKRELGSCIGVQVGYVEVIFFHKSNLRIVRRKGGVGDFFAFH